MKTGATMTRTLITLLALTAAACTDVATVVAVLPNTHQATPADRVVGGYLEVVIPWLSDDPLEARIRPERSADGEIVAQDVGGERWRMLRLWSLDGPPDDETPGYWTAIGVVCLDEPGSDGERWGWESAAHLVRFDPIPGLTDTWSIEYAEPSGVTASGWVRFGR